MGCNCKVNQQISFLQKKYGDNTPQSKATHIRSGFIIGIKKLLTTIILIPVFPIVGLFLICKHIFSKTKTIDINKTFKIAS